MIHIIFWISFGALVGWVAAILRGPHLPPHGLFAYIACGMLGGLCGGLGGLLLSSDVTEYANQASGLTFAIFGAIAFVTLARYADNFRAP